MAQVRRPRIEVDRMLSGDRVTLLLAKVVLTPLFIAAVTLAGRRWGPAVGGWLAGLPLTSGPVSVFLALKQGPGFAARAAVGTLAGLVGVGCFCLVYARLARHRSWIPATAGGLAAYLAGAARRSGGYPAAVARHRPELLRFCRLLRRRGGRP